MAQKIIIDCDPGIDDALAVVFAHGDPGLEVCGITTVAGNVSLDKTTDNALRVRDFVRMGDVPVVPGSARPLVRPVLDARDVHGDSGLAGAVLPAALSGPSPGHAVDYLIDVMSAAPGEITLIAVGPLTNVALAVRREPALTSLVRDFVIMGGSAGRGNATPAAEFNVLADPEAAAIVFSAGWTVTMVGLDVTLQARVTAAVRERMRGLGPLADVLLLPSLAGYRTIAAAQAAATAQEPGMPAEPDWPDDLGDPAVHDVCAVARVACPELIGCVPALVQVETAGRLTSGMTVTDFAAPAAQCNALVATSIDVGGFWDLVLGSYERVAAGMAERP